MNIAKLLHKEISWFTVAPQILEPCENNRLLIYGTPSPRTYHTVSVQGESLEGEDGVVGLHHHVTHLILGGKESP